MFKRIGVVGIIVCLTAQVGMTGAVASRRTQERSHARADAVSFAMELPGTPFGAVARRLARVGDEAAPVSRVSRDAARALTQLTTLTTDLRADLAAGKSSIANASAMGARVLAQTAAALRGLDRAELTEVLSVLKFGPPSGAQASLWPGECIAYYVLAVLNTFQSFYYYWIAYFPLGAYVVVFEAVTMAICLATPPR